MNKKLDKVCKECDAIIEERESRRAKLLGNIAQAEADVRSAEEAKQAATDAAAYADAADQARKASDVLDFYRGLLDASDAPAMTEGEYDARRAVVRSCAEEAVEAFRVKADDLGAQLVAAYDECMGVVEDANKALAALHKLAGGGGRAEQYGKAMVRGLFIGARFEHGFYSGGDSAKARAWEWMIKIRNGE